MATEIILNQFLIFGVLILIGALAFWRKIMTVEIKNNLAKIIIDVTLPFLIFSTFANMESASPHIFRNGLMVFALAFFNFFIFNLVGKLSSKLLKLNAPQEAVHTLHTMLGNTVFFAFPLLDALFPNGIGIFYGAVYQLASNTVTFTYGVYRLSSGEQKSGWKSLLNLNTFALFLGAAVLVLQIPIPPSVNTAFGSLGRCTSPLSMVYIGAMLASMNIGRAIQQRSIYVLGFNKLLLVPALLAFLYIPLLQFLDLNFSKEAVMVLLLQAAMPCQTIVVVLSHRYNGDHQLAGANLFVTTLLSIITLPVVYFLLDWIWSLF